MKKYIHIVVLLVFTKVSYSQCNILLTGNDFVWCQPCIGSASVASLSGTPPYSYLWSTNDTISNITNLCAGTYSVMVTDSLGCIATDSVTISQMGTPMTVSTSSTAPSCLSCCDICISVTPTGGCPPYNYTWSPNDPNLPSPCIACANQSYSVIVTDACGCTIMDSITTDTVAVTTGINNISFLNVDNIIIYPNPSNNQIYVKHDITNNATIQFITLKGEIYKTFTLKNKAETYNIEDLPKGIYVIKILSGQKTYYQSKLIKE